MQPASVTFTLKLLQCHCDIHLRKKLTENCAVSYVRTMSEQKPFILTTIASCLSSRDSFRKLLHVSIMEDGHLFKTLRPLWKGHISDFQCTSSTLVNPIIASRNLDDRDWHLRRRLCIFSTNKFNLAWEIWYQNLQLGRSP